MKRPTLEWSDKFLIGIEELDYEHHCLVDDINKLHRELAGRKGADKDIELIKDTLGEIHARMQAHFALEEHVMEADAYPHYWEHKAEHEKLLDDYTEFMTKFERDPNMDDQEAMEDTLRLWIVDHIIASDKKMSRMIKDANK
ncbi:MAG: hypothetical protein A3G18_02195 [Rhodospirillales bacterium RIFCSPLOWO2_12_FULL_58_28]|nr:MAG: hypothetical protein A3H92_07320 [Rhodospirillales bacterium RIFCSPLOWO2_02_FULL_58_16]OHC79096.1 MAG: hypothetical protein A3G18_02195 [Rhodospirillales bacterium RIFCSPLOWO2_12_FULL_58_28]